MKNSTFNLQRERQKGHAPRSVSRNGDDQTTPVSLEDFLKRFPGFHEEARELTEEGRSKVTCGDGNGGSFTLTLSAKGMITPVYARQQEISIRSALSKKPVQPEPAVAEQHFSVRYRDGTKAGMTFHRKGDRLSIQPSDARYLKDESLLADDDPQFNARLGQRVDALVAAQGQVADFAEAYERHFGLKTRITPDSIELTHPLLEKPVRCDAGSPLPSDGDAVKKFFVDALVCIFDRHKKLMALIEKLPERGFDVQQTDSAMIISRPAEPGFEPLSLPLAGEEAFHVLMEDAERRVQALLSRYRKVPPQAPALPAPAPVVESDIPDVGPRAARRLQQKSNGHAAAPAQEEEAIAPVQPGREVPALSEKKFRAICGAIADMPRVTLIFDSNVLRLFDLARRPRHDSQPYGDILKFAERNPAVACIGAPSAVIDMEKLHRIPDVNRGGPQRSFIKVYDAIFPDAPIAAVESNDRRNALYGGISRWAVDAHGKDASRFIPGPNGGKMVVWESESQHQLFQRLLRQAVAKAGVTEGKPFEEAFMEARKTTGKNAGEDFCLEIAKDYPGREQVIIVSDDKRSVEQVGALAKQEAAHTKGGGPISWMKSMDFFTALNQSCGGQLMGELDKMRGAVNGNRNKEGINEIFDSLDFCIGHHNHGTHNYREMQHYLPAAVYGYDRAGNPAPDLLHCLKKGWEALELKKELAEVHVTAEFMGRVKEIPDVHTRRVAREIITGKPDLGGSSRIY